MFRQPAHCAYSEATGSASSQYVRSNEKPPAPVCAANSTIVSGSHRMNSSLARFDRSAPPLPAPSGGRSEGAADCVGSVARTSREWASLMYVPCTIHGGLPPPGRVPARKAKIG